MDESVFLFGRLKEGDERLNCGPLTGTLPLIYTCVLHVWEPFVRGLMDVIDMPSTLAVPPRQFSRPTPTPPVHTDTPRRHTPAHKEKRGKSSLTWTVLIGADDGRRREARREGEREGEKHKEKA